MFRLQNIFLVLTIIVSAFFWHSGWSHRNEESIPNPDIFQYIGDGNQYLQFKLPKSIHPPPLAPIIITATSKIIKNHVTYPEIKAAKLINISLSSLSLIFIYLLLSQITSEIYAFMLVVLTATNQIFRLYSIGITNDATYTFFLVISIYIYIKVNHPLKYIFFGLLFLLRYEAIAIPVAFIFFEYFRSHKLPKIKHILYGFSPIIIWLLILNYHSQGNSLVENAYLNEIWNGAKNIPNINLITSLIDLLVQDSTIPTGKSWTFAFVFFGILYLTATKKYTNLTIKTIYLLFCIHLLFLYFFPNFAHRYFTPVIWIFYLILTHHKSRLISFTIISCLLFYNFGRINISSNIYRPHDMSEYRLAADWLNSKNFEQPVTIIMFEPHILKYFVTNPQVTVLYDVETPFATCMDEISCIAMTVKKNSSNNSDVYVVTSSYTQDQLYNATDKFTAMSHHVSTFTHNFVHGQPGFKFIDAVSNEYNNWANFYQYTP